MQSFPQIALAVATGLVAGVALAFASRALAGLRGLPEPNRLALFAAAAALLAAWAVATAPGLAVAALGALLGCQLLLIAVTDAEHFWLPDRLTLPLLATGLGGAALLTRGIPRDALIGAVAGFALLWLLARAYRALRGREGLGGGDPFLLAAGGAWVGWIGLPSVLLWSAAAGLSVVVAMKATGRAVAADTRLPFGVFLAVGVWMTWIFGPLGT